MQKAKNTNETYTLLVLLKFTEPQRLQGLEFG